MARLLPLRLLPRAPRKRALDCVVVVVVVLLRFERARGMGMRLLLPPAAGPSGSSRYGEAPEDRAPRERARLLSSLARRAEPEDRNTRPRLATLRGGRPVDEALLLRFAQLPAVEERLLAPVLLLSFFLLLVLCLLELVAREIGRAHV